MYGSVLKFWLCMVSPRVKSLFLDSNELQIALNAFDCLVFASSDLEFNSIISVIPEFIMLFI